MAYQEEFVSYYDLFKKDEVYQKTVEKLDTIFKQHGVKTVLDVGCGTGKIDKLLSDKGYQVIGIDYSVGMVNRARKMYPQVQFEHMGAQDFKFDQEFDSIIALDSVLTFLREDKAFGEAIRNMVSHMHKGSILYFDIAFTEKLIPTAFSDHLESSIEYDSKSFGKIVDMERKGDLLISTIKITENSKVKVQEIHKHRILKETDIINLLQELGCAVETEGNSPDEYCPLKVLAKK